MSVANTSTFTVGEAAGISKGCFVRLEPDTGLIHLAKNDISSASTHDAAIGFVDADYAVSAIATVYHYGINANVSTVVVGTLYYLGTSGGVTATRPTANGKLAQSIGTALTTSSILFSPGEPTIIVA